LRGPNRWKKREINFTENKADKETKEGNNKNRVLPLLNLEQIMD